MSLQHLYTRKLTTVLISLLAFAGPLMAERLPVKIYTSDDGLGSSALLGLVRDHRGFIWLCSRDGLVRFDGYRFITYRIGDDTADPAVFGLLPTRSNVYWINLNRGIDYRFIPADENAPVYGIEPAGNKNDQRIPLNVEPLPLDAPLPTFEDDEGNLWTANSNGLVSLHDAGGHLEGVTIPLDLPGNPIDRLQGGVYKDAKGEGFWIGTHWGLVRRFPSGKTIHFAIDQRDSADRVFLYDEDQDHRIWIARPDGLIVLKTNVTAESESQHRARLQPAMTDSDGRVILPDSPDQAVFFPFSLLLRRDADKFSRLGYQKPEIYSVHAASDGKIWLSSNHGLIVFDGSRFQQYTTEQGLASDSISAVVEDNEGQIWLSTYGGLHRINPHGFTSFDESDGLERSRVHSIYQTSNGEIYIVSGNFNISRRNPDGSFTMVHPKLPPGATFGWQSTAAFLDSRGDWWINTMEAVYRFSGVKKFEDLNNMAPTRVYTEKDGLLAGNNVKIFENSKGDMWFSTWVTTKRLGLSRWSRETGEFTTFESKDGLPQMATANAFAEDNAGNQWFGFIEGGLMRYRDGKFYALNEPDMPETGIVSIYRDAKGRMWIATGREGLFRVDNPEAEHPIFRRYTIDDGLSSNNVRCVIDDEFGNIYVGNVRGIDRLSPETGRIKYFGTSDGLASDFINTAMRDRNGTLWFGTFNGLSKLVPTADSPPRDVSVSIGGLRIAGVDYSISPIGQNVVNVPDQSADQNNVEIDFFSAGADSSTLYQYRLEGSDADWSTPTTERSVNLASLAPASYRFLVRAISPDGAISSEPAVVSFNILRPIYRRWWFIGLVSLLFAGTLLMLYRYRISKTEQVKAALEEVNRSRQARLLELERVRRRIAADLHDDIGSSLSQIAVLSEFAQQGNGHNDGDLKPLEQISEVSNELVEAMSDIVWAIDPRKDNLRDLLQRMRRFASDILTAKAINFTFEAPEFEDSIQFGADVRREIFVIFKEAVNNVVRHSGASEVAIKIEIDGGKLKFHISDNGRGFDVDQVTSKGFDPGVGGNGVANMKMRAASLNADLMVDSSPNGTVISLSVPIDQSAARSSYPRG